MPEKETKKNVSYACKGTNHATTSTKARMCILNNTQMTVKLKRLELNFTTFYIKYWNLILTDDRDDSSNVLAGDALGQRVLAHVDHGDKVGQLDEHVGEGDEQEERIP